MDRTYGTFGRKIPEIKTRCVASVASNRNMGFISHQCRKKRGYGKEGLYCKQHDPERIAEKQRKKDEAYKKKWDKEEEQHCRIRLMAEYFDGISTEEIEKMVKEKEK